MKLRILSVLLGFVFLVILPLASGAADIPIFKVGIAPQQGVRKIANEWIPLLDYVGRELGVKLRFATAPDMPSFDSRLYAGEYDIVYVNPQKYITAQKRTGIRAMLRERDRKLQGIIVIHKESAINHIEQLAGKEMALPSASAFAASQLTLGELNSKGISVKPVYVNNHESVYRNVALKRYVAGGGVVKTFNEASGDITGKLRILWKSREYNPHVIAAHPRVDKEFLVKLEQIMISLSERDPGREVLKRAGFKGFVKAADSDWDDVRELKLDTLLK